MSLIQFVNEIVFALVEGFILYLLFFFLIDRKNFILKYKLKAVIFILFYTVFSYFSTNYTPPGVNTIFHFVFIVLLLSFLSGLSIYSTAIANIVSIILISLVEGLTLPALLLIYKVNVDTLLNTPYYKLVALIITKAFLLCTVFLLFRTNIHTPKFNIFKKENTFAYVLFQILTMTLVVSSITISDKPQDLITFDIFIILIYILSLALGFLDYNERSKLLKVQYKIQAQEENVRNLESAVAVMHKEKHDFCNHLNTIAAICKLNKPDAVQKVDAYISKLTHTLTSPLHRINSGNDYINGFLSMKSSYALEHQIDMDIDFASPIDMADVEDHDLISILGNIIDNAIEAIKADSSLHRRYISIMGFSNEINYVLSIANDGPTIPQKVMQRMFDSGYSTKPAAKGERGYGLNIVKHLVKRNGGEITVTSTPEQGTEFGITFKTKKSES